MGQFNSKARTSMKRLRQLAKDAKSSTVKGGIDTLNVAVLNVETCATGRIRRGKAYREGKGRSHVERTKGQFVTVGRFLTSSRDNPAIAIGKAISDALDPIKAPSKVRCLADMTPEERDEMIRRYSKNTK